MKASHELPTRAVGSPPAAAGDGALSAADSTAAGDAALSREEAQSWQRLQDEERFEDEVTIMHLERDQLVASTSRPVPRARLGEGTTIALWALRVFVIVVSLMVIYTFIRQLH
ncbi:MAG: hypothetical protein ACR2IP_10010 [Solirubrobacteraceae bacterium]